MSNIYLVSDAIAEAETNDESLTDKIVSYLTTLFGGVPEDGLVFFILHENNLLNTAMNFNGMDNGEVLARAMVQAAMVKDNVIQDTTAAAKLADAQLKIDEKYYDGGRPWNIPTMKIIVGPSNERIDDPSFGHIRYNTTNNALEIYGKETLTNSNEWRSLISKDIDQNRINYGKQTLNSINNFIEAETFISYEDIIENGVFVNKQHLKISKSDIDAVGEDAIITFSNSESVMHTISSTSTSIESGSDDRLKHNEEVIPNSLDLIDQLKPYKYQKTDKIYDASYNGIIHDKWVWEIGLIAQDVLAVPYLNFMVNQMPDNGIYTLSYFNLIGLLLQGAKDLYNENKLLKKDIVNCKKDTQDLSGSFPDTIVELNNKIEELESLVLALEN